MQNSSGNLFIISAPSGAGKSSLINALLKKHQDMQVSISHTTRAPRPGEHHGEHYHFTDAGTFKALTEQNDFLEWAEVFGNYYGTSRQMLRDTLARGIDVFLDIDWQGARQIKEQQGAAISIFILPPSLAELENRLHRRGQDSQDVIQKRMTKAQSEMSHVAEYDYLIINENFEQALQELEHIVLSQRNRFQSQHCRHKDLLDQLLATAAK
ncbi:guanylate kinase [Chromatiaceae bacterium AAb-1]|nr:guanylate kinase [Chromatiaceae bacterium AAb-1]